MAAGDDDAPPGPPPPPQQTHADAPPPPPPQPFVDALKRASITSPFAAAECQDAPSVKLGEKSAPTLGRSAGGKAGGPPSRNGGADADAEDARRGRRRRRRSPWLSAPMILGTEISTNITCVRVVCVEGCGWRACIRCERTSAGPRNHLAVFIHP
jgi:hypothetical protein